MKTVEANGFTALQIGAAECPERVVTKPLLGHFAKAEVEPKRVLGEFKVTPDAILPIGEWVEKARREAPTFVVVVLFVCCFVV